LARLAREIGHVIEPVMGLMVAQQCAADEVIIPYENMSQRNAIVNLYGVVLCNVKLAENL